MLKPRMRLLGTIALVCSLVAIAVPGGAVQVAESKPIGFGDDIDVLVGDVEGSLDLQMSDVLGLIPGIATNRDHSLGSDIFEVWNCGTSLSASQLAQELTESVRPWFVHHSRGAYQPTFVAGGDAGASDGQSCLNNVANSEVGANANGILFIDQDYPGGYATAGFTCGPNPCDESETVRGGNSRYGVIGYPSNFVTTAVHEIGHMLQWPHTYTDTLPDSEGFREYDVANELMSGNLGADNTTFGSWPEPYASSAINFYAAGWIETSEVHVHSFGDATIDLSTMAASSGDRLAVIKSGSSYYALSARVSRNYDPVRGNWQGVEAYRVTPCSSADVIACDAAEAFPGYRNIKPSPNVSFDFNTYDAYVEPLAHVIRPGQSRTFGNVTVTVGQRSGQSFPVTFDAPNFSDTATSVFSSEIDWLSDEGITKGCNPPDNTRFCPDSSVTRGQMAAFLVRALGLTDTGDAQFSDDNGSVFESDIERLATAGITRGCNPPDNTRFCPDDPVTRGQMAAFLVRALGLTDAGDAQFSDDNGSVFESDIKRLATAGITRGCNPPDNTRFCPNDAVTRGQMAAFLFRALGG